MRSPQVLAGEPSLIHQSTSYRPDIDGLRAVAVLAVVFFHAKVAGVSGGYVGVDVFFVISGYLITSLIAGEMRQGQFSIVQFYERRARRIFPALFAVFAASTIAGSVILLPEELAEMGESLIAATLFVSNIFFWTKEGYFATQAEAAPLIHTWSLAVEEQFYVFFPILLLLVARFGNRSRVAIIALALAGSLLLSVWGVANSPTGAFYLAPPRAWELLLGALLALGAPPPVGGRLAREAASSVGIVLILWSVFRFTQATPFPGANAVIPCAGAAMIIWAGHGEARPLVNRLLSLKPVVFVGLVSYSLYLWHWPALVFARHYLFRDLSTLESAAIIGVSFLAAILAWRFVERPVRDRKGPIGRRMVIGGSAVAMALLVATGAMTVLARGWPERFPGYADVAVGPTDFDYAGTCFLLPEQSHADWRGDGCFLDTTRGPSNLLLWGDSFAASLLPGLETNGDSLRYRVMEYTQAGCFPVFAIAIRRDVPHCRDFNDRLIEVVWRYDIKAVMLFAFWQFAFEHGLELDDLQNTLMELRRQGVKVFLVGHSPVFGHKVRYIFYKSHGDDLARPLAGKEVNDDLARISAAAGAVFLDPYDALCAADFCRIHDGVGYLFRDYGHLSVHGADSVIRHFLPDLAGSAIPPG
jgi:peptidoglycan/LPS O-acetylase OafA/YrhL